MWAAAEGKRMKANQRKLEIELMSLSDSCLWPYWSVITFHWINIVVSIAVTVNMIYLTWIISGIVQHVSDAYSPPLWALDEIIISDKPGQ